MTEPQAMPDGPKRLVPSRSVLVWSGVAVAAAVVTFGLFGLWRASRAGVAGKAKLLQAEQDLLGQRVDPARQDLLASEQRFRQMRSDLHGVGVGQALAVWRAVPLLRVQVRAADTFANIGVSLAQAGQQIASAAATIEKPSAQAVPLSDSLDKLRAVEASLRGGLKALNDATNRLDALNGYRLVGPIGRARREVSDRLVHIDASAKSAEDGLTALIAFAGGNGPRQYLVLSQNPDEVRPTGGFEGSYGVLTANGGKIRLARYDDTNLWIAAHPGVVVPPDEATSPFRLYDPPLEQTLSNLNTVPDWPQVAQRTLKLWQQGGEQPMDGVVSFTPALLARVLAVTGPVEVPSYGETVTSANVKSRIDYYTHVLPAAPGATTRKEFLSPLGQAVMSKLLATPASQWRSLGNALYKAFSERELLVWSSDQVVQSTVASRGWDGTLPVVDGDFFFDGEVEYVAKNGGGLKRTFDHHVALQPDGSARITTTVTIRNTEGPGPANDKPITYFTMYGPADATLDEASDPPFSTEPSVGGHPAAGWFRAVLPNDMATIEVVWDVPTTAQLLTDGTWRYQLQFMHIVDNPGDVINLRVDLPPHAHWLGKVPPAQALLDHDLVGTWSYRIST